MISFKIDSFSVWEKLQKTNKPVVMYGTGNGADKVLDIFEGLGIKISGVTASSGFVRERVFRGFPVKPVSFFEQEFSDFIVVVAFGSSRPEVIENIKKIAESHKVLVPVVPVIGTEIFDRDYFLNNEEEIEKAYNLLADDFSKKVYEGYINFLWGGELSALWDITTPEAEAYENIIKISKEETFVDIGAYRGDTVEKFLKLCGGEYKKIIAAEPDFKTFNKLMNNCSHLKNFKAENCAVTDIDGEVYFSHSAGRQSALGGITPTKSLTLTALCQTEEPTFIKIDSEGCELQILKASPEILKKYKPKLNIAAYHKIEDIFKLPVLINRINPQYKIHLRHHPYVPAWDTIFYCV